MIRTLVLCVVIGLLSGGCGRGEPGSASAPAKKRSWPMSAGQLDALKKMTRAEREAWFAEFELPKYDAKRRAGEIKIDGVLDEPAWRQANVVTLREGALGGPVKYGTRARMLWDDEAMYLAFECDDPDVHAPKTLHDDKLWENDLVEVFIDADSDGKSYVELHVAASGATCDVLWADYRPQDDWFTDPTWKRFKESANVEAYNPKGVASAVKVDGTLNDPSDTDKGWTVEWRIPFEAIVNVVPDEQKDLKLIDAALFKQIPVATPKPGAVWRMNFNRCDDSIQVTEKDAKGNVVNVPEYQALAPTTGSNHMPFLFGRVRFVD